MGAPGYRPTFLFRIILLLYSLLTVVAKQVARCLSPVFPRIRRFHQGRIMAARDLEALARQRSGYARAWLYFVSSAGEYEQALPLMERVERRGDTFQLLVFFSESGVHFAKVRGEQRPFLKAPYDLPWEWRRLLAVLKPELAIVVRHELWPGFLMAMQEHGPVSIINATDSHDGKPPGPLARFVKSSLLQMTQAVYVANQSDTAYFAPLCRHGHPLLQVMGDTKFDRVIERARQASSQVQATLPTAPAGLLRFVVGSCWPADAEVVAQAWTICRTQWQQTWQLVIVPHELSPVMFDKLTAIFAAQGLAMRRLSAMDKQNPHQDEAILVDSMGKLAEIYGAANAALVGGAFHHKVHNVLEPAVRGLFVAVGPRYKNSREAIQLVEDGLLTVVDNAEALAQWWLGIESRAGTSDQAMLAGVQSYAGAAERILLALDTMAKTGRVSP